MATILVIPDLHVPYHHPDAMKFLARVKSKHAPSQVLSIGDEVDNHAISFHDHDQDLPSAGHELELAIKELQPLYKLFPKMDLLESNHGSLVMRKAMASGLPRAIFKSYGEILKAPKGWKWHFDLVLKTELGPIYFHHSKGVDAKKNSQAMGMSFVQGHHHEQFEIRYWGNPNALLFGATVGCLVNHKSMAMAYNKNNLRRPVLGCMIIKDGVPQLIPMIMDKNGRWTGRL